MSGLDRIRVPETKRWIASVIIGVATIMGLMVSASWWASGPWWQFVLSAIVSALVGVVVSAAFLGGKPRR